LEPAVTLGAAGERSSNSARLPEPACSPLRRLHPGLSPASIREGSKVTNGGQRARPSCRSRGDPRMRWPGPPGEKAAATTKQGTREAAQDTAAAGSGATGSLRQIITMPSTVARQIAGDVVTTVRRPDAVLYLGGLVGLAGRRRPGVAGRSRRRDRSRGCHRGAHGPNVKAHSYLASPRRLRLTYGTPPHLPGVHL
jgi:hypothetical protein